MNKNESKYFNTAVKMDQALIFLLEKKNFEYITIKEICSSAGVNRSTFYLHYENTYDLLKETTQYITAKFNSYFSKNVQSIINRVENADLKELMFITPEYLTPYLTFIKENQRIFKTSIKHLGTMGFDGVYHDLFQIIFNPVLTKFEVPEKEKNYILKFYLVGITAIIMEWLENNCTDSIDFICKIVMECVIWKIRWTEYIDQHF